MIRLAALPRGVGCAFRTRTIGNLHRMFCFGEAGRINRFSGKSAQAVPPFPGQRPGERRASAR
ncbi:MAG: hypothetical protein J5I93_07200, partial [Pirellulaceae bacterium]|nr:hypothetical protein [Pirellulaceae bacterium]